MKNARRASASGFASARRQNHKRRAHPDRREADAEPMVEDINQLFDMGFISIEEVDTFDPKKYQEREQEEEGEEEEEEEAGAMLVASEMSPLDSSAQQAGWTVTTLSAKRVKPSQEDEAVSTLDVDSSAGCDEADKKKKLQQEKLREKRREKRLAKREAQREEKRRQKETVEKDATTPALTPVTVDAEELPLWRKYPLHPLLLAGLKQCGFAEPMPIQGAALSSLLIDGKRDVMASAPTGSGKTLAFGLPMLQDIYMARERAALVSSGALPSSVARVESDALPSPAASPMKTPSEATGESEAASVADTLPAHAPRLGGLVIVPTRELAIQIERHLQQVAVFCPERRLRIAVVVGGLSAEKQERQLASSPDIVIATPGRLAECMEFDLKTRALLRGTRYLVLDEADRMMDQGHYRELDDILGRIITHASANEFPKEEGMASEAAVVLETASATPAPSAPSTMAPSFAPAPATRPPHILLFSATLRQSDSRESAFARLCRRLSLHHPFGPQGKRQRRGKSDTLCILDFAGRVATLEELVSPCGSAEEKEAVLLMFLEERRRASANGQFGRVLVFVNAIGTIRRLVPLFTLLDIPTSGLHAQMQQRQRLRNLDRFRSAGEALLIASDVAARGLDIQGVDHVVHFHLPTTRETYVHRCGRTARASHAGTSLALVAPEERREEERCGLTTRTDIARFLPDLDIMRRHVTPLLKLARQVEAHQHAENSANAQVSWAEQAADDLGIILDEDNDPSFRKRQEQSRMRMNSKTTERQIAAIREDIARHLTELRRVL